MKDPTKLYLLLNCTKEEFVSRLNDINSTYDSSNGLNEEQYKHYLNTEKYSKNDILLNSFLLGLVDYKKKYYSDRMKIADIAKRFEVDEKSILNIMHMLTEGIKTEEFSDYSTISKFIMDELDIGYDGYLAYLYLVAGCTSRGPFIYTENNIDMNQCNLSEEFISELTSNLQKDPDDVVKNVVKTAFHFIDFRKLPITTFSYCIKALCDYTDNDFHLAGYISLTSKALTIYTNMTRTSPGLEDIIGLGILLDINYIKVLEVCDEAEHIGEMLEKEECTIIDAFNYALSKPTERMEKIFLISILSVWYNVPTRVKKLKTEKAPKEN
jgi:hypothetical protein